MSTGIRAEIDAAARKRGIDLAADPEALWCSGVLENAPADAARMAVGRRCPFRVLELADALRLDPDSLNDVYRDWILRGGSALASLPAWAFDRNQTQPWRSDIGPPADRGFGGFSAPVGEPVRLAPTPRVRAAPSGLRSWGSLIFIGYVVLGLIALVLNLSGSGNNTPGMPNGYLPQEHARHPITPMFPGAAATAESPRRYLPPAER